MSTILAGGGGVGGECGGCACSLSLSSGSFGRIGGKGGVVVSWFGGWVRFHGCRWVGHVMWWIWEGIYGTQLHQGDDDR